MTARGTAAKAKRVRTTKSPSRIAEKPRTLGVQLAEAREQQAATAEILRVISQSPADVQPVFETIAAHALRLCDASFSTCCKFDGELIHLAALHHMNPEGVAAFHAAYPCPPNRGGTTQRAILTGSVVHIPDVLQDPEYVYHDAAKSAAFRSVLSVPLLRDGLPIGAISVFKAAPKPFADTQIDLLKTFADQAVIAIENVRLFNETKEALDQQTATARILQAISSSPGDLEPVLETVVRAAAQFCNAPDVLIMRLDHDVLRGAAAIGPFADVLARGAGSIEAIEIPLRMGTVAGRSALQCRSIHVHDLAAEREDEYPEGRELQRRFGHRTIVSTPLLREGVPLGVIVLFRTEVRPFSDKQLQLVQTFADQAVIAIENVRLFTELEERNSALTESLEQQTATSDILRVISQSPTNVQPVFDTIATAALGLCRAHSATVLTFDGKMLELAALAIANPEGVEAIRLLYPRPAGRDSAAGRAVQSRKSVVVADVLKDPEYVIQTARARATAGFRSVLSVPLMREGSPIGTINVGRREPGTFPDTQIALLQTFADQAVIAIENVRLFTELGKRNRDLTEALEQQTATSNILRVISQSPTDVQPVFDTIAVAALKLCNASSAVVTRFDGELIRLAALANVGTEGADALRRRYPRPPGRDTANARAILTRTVVAIPDTLEDVDYEIGAGTTAAPFRGILAVPLLRDGSPTGTVSIARPEPGPFPETQIELLKTFADQAVIAIENVRLFKELEQRNSALTEALEQQTATSDILRVISQSPRDVQPVFDTIAAAAFKLCRASSATLFTFDGELIRLASFANVNPEGADAVRRTYPRPPSRDTAATRAVLTGRVVAIPDVREDPEYAVTASSVAAGFRSVLSVPLIRNRSPIGAISVGKPEPGLFPDEQIALLQTFADQAVIAIENVRLFTELGERNRDLTEALEQQTATSDILRVISRSQTDVQPVFDTIVNASMRLCRASAANFYTFDGELIHLVALENVNPEYYAAIHGVFPRPPGPDTAVGRAIQERNVVMIPDVLEERDYAIGPQTLVGGFRSVLAVPLLRENSPIGAIIVGAPEPGVFPDSQIALLQTFADQAVIAIENVRLFKELEARNRDLTEALEQQTATSDILRVISQSQTDVQPVFDTIVRRVMSLCDAAFSGVYLLDGETLSLAATAGLSAEERAVFRKGFPRKIGPDTVTGRAALEHRVVQTHDLVNDPEFAHAPGSWVGARTVLGVPLMRDGKVIGAIGVWRAEIKPFSDTQIALLQTFADQGVIAIENVRLFNELETRNHDLTEALEQQTATSDILRVISQSQTDVQPVFDTIARSVLALCRAQFANVFTYDGKLIHLAAFVNVHPEYIDTLRLFYPRPPGRATAVTRAIESGSVCTIADVLADPEYQIAAASATGGFRSILAVPLMRDGKAVGGIAVGRPEPGDFPESQVMLLQTFADQAVIAIENVRLFKELEQRNSALAESLEQQTATSDILRVISQSPRDVQPVFDTIAAAAFKLCRANSATVSTYDGKSITLAAFANWDAGADDAMRSAFPRPAGNDTAHGRAIVTGGVVAIPDILQDPEYGITPASLAGNTRSILAVPLLRAGEPVGAIGVGRTLGPFPDKQVALLQTFADQAVIAIENVRLFTELEARTTELTQSVGELKALGEVGQAVSSTLDLETVLSTIVSRAAQLAGMDGGSIWEYDEASEEFYLRATDRLPEELVEALRATPIRKERARWGG